MIESVSASVARIGRGKRFGMDRAEKQAEIKELTESFKNTKVTLCADYRGLTVAKVTALRKLLREKGARARVVKNTLARISAKSVLGENGNAEMDRFLGSISSTTMLIFANEDPVAPAKVIQDFAKTNEKLQVRSGWFEGRQACTGHAN